MSTRWTPKRYYIYSCCNICYGDKPKLDNFFIENRCSNE